MGAPTGTIAMPAGVQTPVVARVPTQSQTYQDIFSAQPALGGKGGTTTFIPTGMNTVAQQVAAAPVGSVYNPNSNGGSGGWGTPSSSYNPTTGVLAPVVDRSTYSNSFVDQANAMPGDPMNNLMSVTNSFGTGGSGYGGTGYGSAGYGSGTDGSSGGFQSSFGSGSVGGFSSGGE